MTNEQFIAWIETHYRFQIRAANALGCNPKTVAAIVNGDQPVPKRIALACAWIALYGDQDPWEKTLPETETDTDTNTEEDQT